MFNYLSKNCSERTMCSTFLHHFSSKHDSDGARSAVFLISELCCSVYCLCRLCCSMYCLCKCVLYYCHRVSTKLQLNISYLISPVHIWPARPQTAAKTRVSLHVKCTLVYLHRFKTLSTTLQYKILQFRPAALEMLQPDRPTYTIRESLTQ